MAPKLPELEKYKETFEEIERNGIYSNFGPIVKRLESNMASYFGVPENFVASCANATLGLEGLFATSNAEPNSTWETPSWTFAATNLAALRSQLNIKFRDVDLDGRIIPNLECKNLIDVLPFGEGLDYSRYPNDIEKVVIDAAASFDALKLMNFPLNGSIAIVISMHATKLMAASGEGGIVISNDPDWISRFKKWSNFGFDSDRDSEFIGTNAKMSEYAAAFGLASLGSWEQERLKWDKIRKRAIEISSRHELKIHSSARNGFVSPYWIVTCPSEERLQRLEAQCKVDLIETRRWWRYGNHTMKAFAGIESSNMENSNKIARTTIGLPFHLGLTEGDFARIEMAIINSN
jgi:dTDP-4-amino-4,6-dideoxygalactose transaminase